MGLSGWNCLGSCLVFIIVAIFFIGSIIFVYPIPVLIIVVLIWLFTRK